MSESSGLSHVLAPLRALGRRGWAIGLLLLATYGYFVGAPAWNQNSRLALTRAMVEHRSFVIDEWHATTGDKSRRDGHFYSDKAPGVSLLATVPYAALWLTKRVTAGELPDVRVQPLDPLEHAARRFPDPESRGPGDRLVYNQAHRLALYLCQLATASLLGVIGAAAVYLLALHSLGGDVRRALVVGLAHALATPAFVYATSFYGHGPCADLLVVAFALVVLVPPDSAGRLVPALAGAALGLAVLCEYPAVLAALPIAIAALVRLGPRCAAWMILGAAPLAGVLALYHTIAFGHPFATGYDWVYLEPFAEGMRERYGIHAPDAGVLLEQLFGSYRGLFYLSPILLLATWGLLHAAIADPSEPGVPPRGWTAVAIAIVLYYVLLNAGYYMWDGGASFGPRHMVPMLPFLALGLAPALTRVPTAFVVLAIVSVLHMLAGAAAGPEAPQHGNPLWEYAIPRTMARDAAPESGGTNLGLVLGLPGALALVPLVALWLWSWPMVFRRD